MRHLARPLSGVLLSVALAMALCTGVAWGFELLGYRSSHPPAHLAMLASAVLTGALGLASWRLARGAPDRTRGWREAVAEVLVCGFAVCFVSAFPYLFSGTLGPIDALFESVSGLTTTGATVFTEVEGAVADPILLWRSLTQWLGGLGIVVLFVAFFPGLGLGRKHQSWREVPVVPADGVSPRIPDTARALVQIYIVFTVAILVAYRLSGMELFESLNHALTTLSTGGFSVRDGPWALESGLGVELTAILGMVLAGVHFGLYFAVLRTGRFFVLLRSAELRIYFGILTMFSLGIGASLWLTGGIDVLQALRRGLFVVTSALTTTGYHAGEQTAGLPGPALLLVIALMFMGASSGSPSGGFKLGRILLLLESARIALRRTLRPSVVQVARLDRRVIDDSILLEVATLFFLYVLCLFSGMFFLAWSDMTPLPTAFGAMLSVLSNVGLAPFHEGAAPFASYSGPAKLMFAFAMVIGRLEFLAVLALFVPDMWRR